MTIQHHPSDVMLGAYAAGTLDPGETMVVATHVSRCPHCAAFARALTHVGGAVLEGLHPAPMADDALAKLLHRLDHEGEAVPRAPEIAGASDLDQIPGLSDRLRRCKAGRWKWIAPGLQARPILLPQASPTRLFLLKAAAGTVVPEHSHTGLEMTCVLAGAFRHHGERFGPGDFDVAEQDTAHRPVVDAGEPCICLVAMRGDIRLKGWVGRLVRPFIRL